MCVYVYARIHEVGDCVCECVRGVSLRPSCVRTCVCVNAKARGCGGGRERERKGEVADPALFTDQSSKETI